MALGSGTYMINQDGSLVSRSGSSYASPQVAGLITGIWQAFPDLTVKELLDAVRLSSTHVFEPGNRMGYGIPSYRAVVNYLEQFSANDWISIYPNPISANDLNVRVTNPSEDNSVQIELFNTLGQPILIGKESITWQNNEYILDVSTLPRGIYVLNLQSSNNFTQLKFSRL